MEKNLAVEIAKYIGQPIDPNLALPFGLGEICEFEVVDPGEKVYTYNTEDSNVDDVYTVDSNGAITTHKVSPVAPAELTFAHLNSKLEYVLVSDVMDAPDQNALGRKKAAITRAMDKEEAKRVFNACLALSTQEVAQASGEDLYDLVIGLKHKVEDYGDNYVLLVGSAVKEAIDTYEKDNADNFNYNVSLKKFLADASINVIKVVGNVKLDGGSSAPILATNKLILVARNSFLAQGKPCLFVRRRINPEIAKGMGVEPDAAQRAVVVSQTPSVLYGTSETLGYGVLGYESIIQAILNKRAIAWATYTA